MVPSRLKCEPAWYHNEKALGTSSPVIVSGESQADRKRLVVMHDLTLGPQLRPGDYTLRHGSGPKRAPEGGDGHPVG